jgi:hypothetical protein
MIVLNMCFVLGRPFQAIRLFVHEVRSLPYSEAPERIFTQVGSGLTHKHYTRLELLTRDKHTFLLLSFVNYGHKKPYNIGPFSSICGHGQEPTQGVKSSKVFLLDSLLEILD